MVHKWFPAVPADDRGRAPFHKRGGVIPGACLLLPARAFMIGNIWIVLAGLAAGLAIDAAAGRYARHRAPGDGPLAAAASRMSTVLTMIGGGAVSAAALVSAPGAMLAFSLLLGWLLLALAAIDLKTFLLPDLLNAGVFGLGALMVWMTRPDAWMMHVAGAVIGYAVLWAVETGYRRLRGIDGLGRGDAKLLGALGMWVGALGLPPVLLIASLAGLAAALLAAWTSGRSLSGQSAIAFGPWIALGGYVVWLAPFLSTSNG